MRSLIAAGLALLILPACVVVVGNEVDGHDSYTQHDTPRIGVELSRPSPAIVSQTGIDPARSCMITHVEPNCPAADAGLQKYDLVTAIDGRDYATISALRDAVRSRKPGEKLTLNVLRAGKPQEVSVTVGDY
jgi:serine protease Do